MQRKFFRFRIIQAGGVLYGKKGFHGIPQPEEIFFTFQEFSWSLEPQAMKRRIHGDDRETIPNLLLFSRKIHQENKKQRGSRVPGASYNKIWILNEGFVRFWKNHPEKLGLLIISNHKNSCLKGEPQGRNWEFFTDLLTNHFLPQCFT